MCGGGKAPPPQRALPETPRLPDQDASLGGGAGDRRRRAAAAGGEGGRSTVLTSSRGVQQSGTTASKTLLGA